MGAELPEIHGALLDGTWKAPISEIAEIENTGRMSRILGYCGYRETTTDLGVD